MFHGIQRLLVLLALSVPALVGTAHGQTVGLLRQVWEGIGGVAVTDLTSSPNYPNNPTSQNYVTDFFEAPTDVLESYGQRMHGYVVPPLTGNYTFWIASDDGGALYLATDENPANTRLIAQVAGWTSSREWTREAGQQSAPIPLIAGKAYYVSALMKEGGGGDNLAVRWLMPNGTDQAPIVATNLLPWGVSFAPPSIARQPAPTTVVEGGTASFTVQLGTVGPASYQWRRNGLDIPGATGPELLFTPARLSDNGARFSVFVTNSKGSVTSAEAALSVTPDVTAPTLVAALNIGTRTLRVTFSEPVSASSALVATQYTITPSVRVISAAAGASPNIVELTLDPLTYGAAYTLAVRNVQDQAQTPNTIAPNASLAFTAFEYSPAPIGSSPIPGSVTSVPGGVDVAGSGDISNRSDALEFAYQPVSGNFDRRVRVAAFTPTDPFARAGLMARASLDTNSVFAAALTTPAQLGSFFMARTSATTDAAKSGGYPPNFPETWLRLSRVGNVFRAYASIDGTAWTELGNATIAMPATVLLGFAVGSGTSQTLATARFRDAGDTPNPTLTSAPRRRGETPGPSSRATALAISEIMYHPKPRPDGRLGEFIEIYNSDLIAQDLTGFRISGSVDYSFPDGYRLPAGGYAVIARNPADLEAIHGITGVLGPFNGTNNLPNNRGTVRLRSANGAVILDAKYDNRSPWPVAADGAGHSLVLNRPSYGEGDPRAWAASEIAGGSPGTLDTLRANPHANVLINEVLAHTDLPQLDTIELYNHGNSAVDLSGCVLTDDATTNRFRIPSGTILIPRGFLAFDETQLGFRLNAASETIYLFNPDQSRVLDAVHFGPQQNGVSTGRFPDGTPEWRRLKTVTLGAENAPFRVADVVINEIMYAPISGDQDDQYIELFNRTPTPIDISGWSLSDGVGFRFPKATTLPAGAYFVVARNRDRLLTRYPGLAPTVVFGNFSGSLSGRGERLALAMPDLIVSTNAFGLSETNRIDIEVDEVTYGAGGAWGQWSDGGGSSLELIDPYSDHLRPSNWADSDETAKAPWTTIEFTGRVDNVADNVPTDRIHLVAFGAGEYMIDDVEVIGPGATNRLANGNFTSGLTGWTAQGNHRNTTLSETGGINGSRALHLITPGRGDTSVNRVRAAITPSLALNATATLRAKVRWMRGWPEFLLRTHGSGIEAYGVLSLPTNLGTPGAPNSRAIANAGPAIVDVKHSPPVPNAGEPVVVSARITDPDGVASATLVYRNDGSTTFTRLAMRDDGTRGDEVAGDGIFSATLPGAAGGIMVAFRVEATDLNATPATGVFPPTAPNVEALVRWGEPKPFGNLGIYRLWQRQAEYNRLRTREPLANDNIDCTFVYGDERVIYNAGMRAKGSPWHGGSVGGDYLFAMPDDNKLLGDTDVAIVTIGNLGSDPSAQREQTAFWIGERLGVAALHRRHGNFYENGGFKGLYEDTEEPNGQFVDSRFPDGPNGDLYKIEDWFEFDDVGSSFIFSRDATLQKFTTADGSLKLARYRWAWRKRAVKDSSSDYAQFFQLVQALNTTGATYAPRVDNLADIDGWMRDFATQHIVGNWDAYGYGRGKNSYLYLPPGGRWQIVPWDIDFVLGSGGDGPTTDVFGSVDPVISTLWNTPVFRRMYWRAFQDAINGPLRESEFLPIIESRYRALVANGFNVENFTGIRNFINQRRTYLQGRIAAEDVASLAITSNNGANFSTNKNLVTLTGSAPIAVQDIQVNGVPFPVTWLTVNTWSLAVPLGAVTNTLDLVGLNRRGEPVPGATDSITVRYTGTPPRPEDFIVINEIQYHPALPGAGFIELYNTSATGAFDLSGWRLDGAGFDFPQGTILKGGAYLVLAADLEGFRNAYGTTVLPVGVFTGSLQNNGERLRLIQPGATPDLDRLIDEVRYDNRLPWPTNAAGFGPALQLIDPRQDNRRVANWAAAPTNSTSLASPGTANSLTATLDPFPEVWLNEVLPQNPTGITDSAGGHDPWIELFNAGATTVDLSGLFLAPSTTNLAVWTFPAGTTLGPKQFLVVWCDGETAQSTPAELHTNFRLSPTNGVVTLSRFQSGAPAVLDYLEYRDLPAGKGWGSYPDEDPYSRQLFHLPTPGARNNNGAPNVQVFINEWLASNAGVVIDPADGDPDDWFELYNAGSTAADLSAYTITDDLTHPDKARIPNGTVIPPGGYLIVWADEESSQSTNGQLHVNFKLAGTGEALGLYAPNGTAVDTLTFGPQTNNVSQGRFPDGAPAPFLTLDYPSPAAPNVVGTANHPPTLTAIPDLVIDEGTTAAFRATATDADAGQELRFSLLGAPATAAIDPVSGSFSWTTTESDGPGTFVFSVRVTDNGAPPRFDSKTVSITVREANLPPAFTGPTPSPSIDEGQTLTFTLAASDPDAPAQKLTFTLEPGAPDGLTINPASGAISWTPTEQDGPGIYPITARVTDDGTPPLSAKRTFNITVNEIDNPPVIEPIGLQLTDETVPFSIRILAHDPDTPARPLHFVLETAPSGAAINDSGVFTWTPPESAGPGSYNIIVRVEQIGGGPSSTAPFSIAVNELNEAPQLAGIPDRVVSEGELVAFTAQATDTDLPAQRLTFRLDPGAPPAASIDPQTGAFSWPIPADAGASTNVITVRVTDSAIDAKSATRSFTVIVQARLRLVINEVMYAPKIARTEFVEILNGSSSTAWDLAGWRLTGLDFTFPAGTVLGAGQFLVIARDRNAFRAAYPASTNVIGDATLSFTSDGLDTVRLQRPEGSSWETIDEVGFLRSAPWPTAANGTGASLQLIDSAQDNRRVANWSALLGTTTNAPRNVVTMTNFWRYKQDGAAPAGWNTTTFNDTAWPSGRGLLYVENAALPEPKSTPLVLTSGRLTYYFRTSFTFDGNPDGAALVLNAVVDDGFVMYLNGREIYRLGMDPAAAINDSTSASRTVGDAINEGPFTIPVTNLVTGNNVLAVEVHQANGASSDIVWGSRLDVLEVKRESSTPGFANSVRAPLAPFPEVWINEVLPRNSNGATDNAGDRDPWIELVNAGQASADLSGLWLTDDLANLKKWPLPTGATLAAGAFHLVWADNEPTEQTANDWHANFRLASPLGLVALVRDQNGSPAVLDVLNYEVAAADQSYGALTNNDPLVRGGMNQPSPGQANVINPPGAPLSLAVVPDQQATAGTQLQIDLKAVESNPGRTLVFSLPAAPTGMNINTATGRITWTPTALQVGAHRVEAAVSDGFENASRQFVVTVAVAPTTEVRITQVEMQTPGELRLTWTTAAGRRYALQESADPASGPWTQIGAAMVAFGPTLSANLVATSLPGPHFLRVVQLAP